MRAEAALVAQPLGREGCLLIWSVVDTAMALLHELFWPMRAYLSSKASTKSLVVNNPMLWSVRG